MNILCVSDQIDPLVYSINIKDRYKDIDMVLSAGDLPLEYLEFIVSSLNKPLLFVFGNHNLNGLSFFHRNIPPGEESGIWDTHSIGGGLGSTYIGFRTHQEANLLFAGASGCLRYNGGIAHCQYTEQQMKRQLLALVPQLLLNKVRYGRYLDVFVAHAAPFGIHDRPDRCHQGFKCFLWFIKTFAPRYFLHGHIHLYDSQAERVSVYHTTTIINVFSNYILKIDPPCA